MTDRRHPQRRVPPGAVSLTPTTSPPDDPPRLLSEADCHAIAERLARFAQGGGDTIATIFSTWTGNVRWARNRISTSGENRDDHVTVSRSIGGGDDVRVSVNALSDPALVAAVRQAERMARLRRATPESTLLRQYTPEPVTMPPLFADATFQLDVRQRAAVAQHVAQTAEAAGMLSAGSLEVSAHSVAKITSWGYAQYFQYTWARCSMTVRDSTGIGSGWAGVDGPDWTRIDTAALSALALDKCLTSRNPVAVEPGRYTTILEPQAVCDFVGQLVYGFLDPMVEFQALDRVWNEASAEGPFNQTPSLPGPFPSELGVSRLGERVADERITISADPMDPELGFPPFDITRGTYQSAVAFNVYHPATWIDRGMLTNLAYDRYYALNRLGLNTGLPQSGAFRMSGGETSVAEMIATTDRGLLVTRFSDLGFLDKKSLLLRGYTRDGLWLIERGKISKPVRNMVVTESILVVLNNVEQLGVPQRAFHPPDQWYAAVPQPVLVPPLKIRDFSFTALTSAI